MPHRFGVTVAAIALSAAGLQPLTCAGQARLSHEHGGVGLQQQTGLPLAPRPYELAGEVSTTLADHRAVSVGIKYRMYELVPGAPGDAAPTNGYTLVPSRPPAASYAPGYQVRLGYQHSTYTLFGFSLGREMETYATAFDPASPYPLQVSFTGQHWLTPSWALSYDLLSGDLAGPSPLRLQGLGLRFGVRYRF